ncbi:hypothetical protein BTVI_02756 [Pitangus sulphuratus]|nr:hypothetical protein BTVI_02756 [Pitangus sulphuratus]
MMFLMNHDIMMNHDISTSPPPCYSPFRWLMWGERPLNAIQYKGFTQVFVENQALTMAGPEYNLIKSHHPPELEIEAQVKRQ